MEPNTNENVSPVAAAVAEFCSKAKSSKSEGSALAALPYPNADVLKAVIGLYRTAASDSALATLESRPSDKAVMKETKLRDLSASYLTALATKIDDVDEAIMLYDALTDVLSVVDELSMAFVSSLILENQKLPIEAFVRLTGTPEKNGIPISLASLRESFWKDMNGAILRDHYHMVWSQTTPEGQELADGPDSYSYAVWSSLIIPQELVDLKPAGFQDFRLG